MLHKIIVLFFLLHLLACGQNKEASNSLKTETDPTAAVANTSDSKEGAKFDGLENTVGKKPSEVRLFEKSNLNKRIEKVLGPEYSDFKADWNEESPIMKDGEILYFVGCKTGACAENKYFIMFDLIENNINIINLRNGRPRSYEEGAVIGMPDKLAADFEKSRIAQGL